MMDVTLSFIEDSDRFRSQKPYELYIDGEQDLPQTNISFVDRKVRLRSARDGSQQFTLDTTGFEIWPFNELPGFEDAIQNGTNIESIISNYISNVITQIQAKLHTEHVYCWDWRYRHADSKLQHNKGRASALPPAANVHIGRSKFRYSDCC